MMCVDISHELLIGKLAVWLLQFTNHELMIDKLHQSYASFIQCL